MVICLKRGADLYMAQLMPLPLTISCSSKIQIGFTFLVPAHLGSPGQRAVKRVCVFISHIKATPYVDTALYHQSTPLSTLSAQNSRAPLSFPTDNALIFSKVDYALPATAQDDSENRLAQMWNEMTPLSVWSVCGPS